jgi:hypothetical protein
LRWTFRSVSGRDFFPVSPMQFPDVGPFSPDVAAMRMITGAILLLAAEQAFAHQVLVPGSATLGLLGLAFLIWGLAMDGRK